MKKKMQHLFLSGLLLFGLINLGFSQTENPESWIQFRGHYRAGLSTDKIAQTDWLTKKPELIWKKEIGSGFSELIISDGIIYTMESEQIDSVTGSEFLIAFDDATGKELWKTKVDSLFIDIDGWGNGPRATPTIDQNNIYSFSGNGKLTAHSKKKGKILWQVDFVKEFGSTCPRWGFSSSPLLVDDVLVMEVGGTEERAFMAFNKKNGQIIWSKAKGDASYNSPLLATIEGQQQIIFANRNRLYSFNSKGDTLWTYKMPFAAPMAMPVLIEPNKLFVSAIRPTGYFVVEIKNNVATKVLNGGNMQNDFNSCSYYNGHLYGFHVAALRCISVETGETKWTKRGYGKGSLILVDDKLLVLSDKGKLILVEAKPDAFEEKGFIQTIAGKSWTAPSFYNGKIYVRNLTEMACYKLN